MSRSDGSALTCPFALVVLQHLACFPLQSLVLLEADPDHQQEHGDQDHDEAGTDAEVLLPRVVLLHHPQQHLLLHLARLHPAPPLRLHPQIVATAVQKQREHLHKWRVGAEGQRGGLLGQRVLVEFSRLDGVDEVGGGREGEGFESGEGEFALGLECFGEAVLLGVPEDVETLVGVDEVVVLSDVEVVEVGGVEDGLHLAVPALALPPLLSEGLHDGRVPLALAEQHQVVAAEAVEGLAHPLPHHHLRPRHRLRETHLHHSQLRVQQQHHLLPLQVLHTHVHHETQPVQPQPPPRVPLHHLRPPAVRGEAVEGEAAQGLGSEEVGGEGGVLLEVDDGGEFGEGDVGVAQLVEQVGPLLVVDDQQRLLPQRVHLELLEPPQVLQVVASAHAEALLCLLDHQDGVGCEEDQQMRIEHKQTAMFEASCSPQFIQHRHLPALVLQRVALHAPQPHPRRLELHEPSIRLQLWFGSEALPEGDRHRLRLTHVAAHYFLAAACDLPDCVGGGGSEEGEQNEGGEAGTGH